ncbi:MAG: LmbE family protein, partial [Gemmatimonadaceae bacterium]
LDETTYRELAADAWVTVDGVRYRLSAPVVHRVADPVRGEVRRPLAVAPAVSVTLDRTVEYARANAPLQRAVRVILRSARPDTVAVTVTLKVPEGVRVDSVSRTEVLAAGMGGRALTFNLTGRLRPGRHAVSAVAAIDEERFTTGYVPVEYDHIRPQKLYRDATTRLEAVDVALPGQPNVAYLPGVSDNVAPMLEQLGVRVTTLDPAALPTVNLSRFSAVVVGPRAYEARSEMVEHNGRLLDYVRNGGTMVVQYGQHEMMTPGIMPYPITLERRADRVTVEEAPVRIVDADSPLLHVPNRITPGDFAGWVQERGLYMPRSFDERYRAPLEMNDPGEPPNRGALLVARYGRGTYVYTTLSFFRQLPAGVPGAARLFANLLGAGGAARPPRASR